MQKNKMEVVSNKYTNGKIYKLYSKSQPNLVYYGSTIQTLDKRHTAHKSACKMLRGVSSSSIIELGDTIIELVENYPCNSIKELHRREGYYILNNECINKFIAGRTYKEYAEEHHDKKKIYHKEYYKANREDLLKKQKMYDEAHREDILKKTSINREKKKQNLTPSHTSDP